VNDPSKVGSSLVTLWTLDACLSVAKNHLELDQITFVKRMEFGPSSVCQSFQLM
jgi:hypothetical protein